jgi:hypothetical protein
VWQQMAERRMKKDISHLEWEQLFRRRFSEQVMAEAES